METRFRSIKRFFLQRKIFDQFVLPVMKYGAKTLTITKTSVNKLRVNRTKMETSVIGITPSDIINKKRGNTPKNSNKQFYGTNSQIKVELGGYVRIMNDIRPARKILEWQPRTDKGGSGRLPACWTDDSKRVRTN